METKIWKMADNKPNIDMLKEAAEYLRKGEVVAFPTETVYGLGANALDEKAVQKIYTAKGRPSDNPLIVHIHNEEQVKELIKGEVSFVAKKLMQRFWPGPLTLVMNKADKIPSIITAGLNTIALRMPAHPVALRLLQIVELPIAAPSANTSGKPSPTSGQHVYDDLNGKIAGIIEAGQAGVGVESTVLDLSTDIPTILRPGGVTWEELSEEIGQVRLDDALIATEAIPRSPGMKYVHYAPDAELYVCLGTIEEIAGKMQAISRNVNTRKVGFMISEELFSILKNDLPPLVPVQILGKRKDLKTITSKLFTALRWFDKEQVEEIYAESYPENSIGAALMNRLYKAAGGKTL